MTNMNNPKLCPSCGTTTMDAAAAGIGRFCPNVECDRVDDLREDVSTPVLEELPEFVTIPASEFEKLQDDLANALESIRELQRGNGKLQFMLAGKSVPRCHGCSCSS